MAEGPCLLFKADNTALPLNHSIGLIALLVKPLVTFSQSNKSLKPLKL